MAYSRRRFLRDSAAASAAALAAGCRRRRRAAAPPPAAAPAPPRHRPGGAPRIAIVGGGVAGLNTAYKLQKAGLTANVFEGANRTGGRMFTATEPARRRPDDRTRRRVHRQHPRRDAGADDRVRARADRHARARHREAQARDLLHQRPPLHPGAGRARRSCRWPRRSLDDYDAHGRGRELRDRGRRHRPSTSMSIDEYLDQHRRHRLDARAARRRPTSPSTGSSSASSRRSTSSS